MARAQVYTYRDMQKILKKNGYFYIRSKGSHMIYTNGTHSEPVSVHLNKFLALGIIKRCNLIV